MADRNDFVRLSELLRLCAVTMRLLAVERCRDGSQGEAFDLSAELERIAFEVRCLAPENDVQAS